MPKSSSPETRLRRLLIRHNLDRIEIVASNSDIFCRAYPSQHGALVETRYQAALTEFGQRKNRSEISLAEVTELRREAVDKPVAAAIAKTIDAAIAGIGEKLKAAEQ